MNDRPKIDVADLRRRLGITQEELAKRLYVSKQRVSQLETNPDPKPYGPLQKALEDLLHALDTAP